MLSLYPVSLNKCYASQIAIKVHWTNKTDAGLRIAIVINFRQSSLCVDTTTTLCFNFIQFVKRRITLQEVEILFSLVI